MGLSVRQFLLKATYPLVMKGTKGGERGHVLLRPATAPKAKVPFHGLRATNNIGNDIGMAAFRGKHLLLVNTASDCGYTAQFDELQDLHKRFGDRLAIIGFPANDFKEQEKGNDKQIAEFCRLNFGVTFPLMQKSKVVPGPEQNTIFHWLSDPNQNGWNSQSPVWNFAKYLVSPDGELVGYFGPAVSPKDSRIIGLLN